MNAYTPAKTALAIHQDALIAYQVKSAEHFAKAAAFANEGHAYIWGLPDAELTEYLNHLGPVRVGTLMTDHGESGTVLNRILNRVDAPTARTRFVVGVGREIVLTDGVFSVTPLPEPELDPE